jgi:hypothetical protein
MLESITAFSEGWRFHIRGIRFGFGHLSFLILSVVPFLITLALYILAFYMFDGVVKSPIYCVVAIF